MSAHTPDRAPQKRFTGKGRFTGKHMLAVMVIGFGIVAAVNFTMASLAVGGFHGIVVDNSYVASQKFNDWIEEADRMAALGWSASAAREKNGQVLVTSEGVPAGAVVTAALRRPLGTREFADLTFVSMGEGRFRSLEPVSEGRWTVRLTIEAQGKRWVEESELK
ncbi:MAG: FixH family protein [Erythrobacter sp.]|uniref:FixH family protein n=1 Tax=Erythrobacter sp. TaxID=1042 RepID=UPI00262052D4|nr:FixH family protein [Erythrobacter sp.]MDJ0977473.1 FixH family protein [Erythrobacter sp.]